jgi:hypothetical protein
MERRCDEVRDVIRRAPSSGVKTFAVTGLLTALVLAAPAFASGVHVTPAQRKAINATHGHPRQQRG